MVYEKPPVEYQHYMTLTGVHEIWTIPECDFLAS